MTRKNGKSAVFLLVACLALPGAASARRAVKIFKADGVQLYGTQRFTDAQLEEKFGGQIRSWMDTRSRGTKKDDAAALRLHKKLVADVKAWGGFAWANLTEAETGRDGRLHSFLLMFDVIEKADMATRFPYRSAPTTSVSDGSKLIESWQRYTQLGWRRVRAGEVSAERGDCPAFFCPEGVGPDNEEIAALERRIASGVPRSQDLLVKIFREDKDPESRAAALYLLGFLQDGSAVANFAADGLYDADPKVREAATALFSDIAVYRKDVPIPIHKVVRLLDSPFPEDRGRGLALVLSLSDNPDYESVLISTAATDILKLLRAKNEANHEMAHTVMSILSGESFESRDYDAWDNWLWKARKERTDKVKSEN